MTRVLLFLFCCCAVLVSPVLAVDRDSDGLDDSIGDIGLPPILDEGEIAIVDTGSSTIAYYADRLTNLGYTVVTIPLNSDLTVLSQYPLVILPVSHAQASTYYTFDGLAGDYQSYVSAGGGLWVGQPNPYGMPGNTATLTWVPYLLTINNGYDNSDCPTVIVDPDHCITTGLPNTNFSFTADTVVAMGSEWQLLCEGSVTGNPSVLWAPFGGGRILVEFCHPSPSSICPIDDAALDRYASCAMSGPTVLERSVWGDVKTLFR